MSFMSKAKRKLNEYWRVLRITRKPNMVEFKTIIKVSALGMAVIGLLGFAIQIAGEMIK